MGDFENIKLPSFENINAVLASDHIPPMIPSEVREEMVSLEISIMEKLLNQNKEDE